MANLYFTHSSAPLKTVQEIQFGLMSPEEIKSMSVAHILYPETMEEGGTKPRDGGLNDPLLGSIDRQFKCKTCTQAMGECPGHFGHIELAKPVYHPGFIKKVKKILEIVCHNCSKVLADESDPEFVAAINTRDAKLRFKRVWAVCKKKRRCENDDRSEKNKDEEFAPGMKPPVVESHGGCGNVQPQVRQVALQLKAAFEVVQEDGPKRKETAPITPEMAHSILRRISEKDLRNMGLNSDYARPEWMIITVLPVPPPPVRPSISMDGTGTGMRNEDDLTYKLGDIIRANGNVKQAIREGSPQHIARDFEELLQYHVATYMDNDIAGQPRALQKSGRPVKAIRARLKGKEGRLRGNLMGKRVDFSARTVITGDANLSLHEVGVPRSIARTLTYPETVTPYNIGKLHQLVENGPNEHPGAKYVIRSDGTRIDLRHHRRAAQISLEYGWKVERHLMDGDYIIFNRQPSLHKESMMGHRVRVMPYSTFRLNLSVTSPYNADFDGDEMNLHVPQSEETRAEVKELCLVPNNIVSPQKNGPLMGIVQDSLAGAYKLCRRDTFLDKNQVMNLMLWVPNWDGVIPQPAILKPRPRWTGKQIISMVIPKEISLHAPEDKSDSPLKDAGLLIQAGELMYGLMKKKNIGSASGGVIHLCYNELGPEGAMAFLNGVQQVVTYWLLQNGHSIGIGDTIPDKQTIEKVQVHIDTQKAEVARLTAMATNNELEALPGMNVRATFENKVSMALNMARDQAGTTTQKSLKDSNNAVTMAESGSKGSSINISQMTALVGQQIVEGKRIPFGFKYRTLPHFTKDDYSPEARGFVENSYLRGLTPTEFFFHAMAGREGLIDTAVKTAETGYIQRRLVKALEDLNAQYDGTVRNSLGDIIQFLYGEDGLDAMCIEKQKMGILKMSDEAFENKYRLDLANPPDWFRKDYEYGNELTGDKASMALLDEEWDQLLADRREVREINRSKMGEEMMQLPLNIGRMIETAKRVFNVKANDRSNLRPSDVIPAVRNVLNKLKIVRGEDQISKEADTSATILFKALLRSRLAFKEVVKEHRLNKLAFDHVLGELQNRWDRSFVNPGEMVGVLAAQSIGEPATQMTLNTFHFAGVSSKNVTLGVPRLKEILNLAKNIKTPGMAVYLDTPLAKQEQAKKLRSLVEYTNLRSITSVTEIYYDPDVQSTTIPEDLDMVESYFLIPDDSQDTIDQQSRWLLRITLDRQKLLDKEIKIDDVAQRIKEEYPNDLAVIFSDNNADEQVIRIRTIRQDEKDEDGEKKIEDDVMLKRLEAHLLDTLTLRGVPGVEKAFLTKGTRLVEAADGSELALKDDPRCTQWYLDTSGSALREVLAVPGVDPMRTYTNDLWQIIEVFGIEGTRAALVKELTAVLAFDGSYVNHRHIALLCDVMTYRGSISAVTRHGINRADTGALMRCSFEETVEILLEAAATGELDDCRGISENVMLGQMAPMGTGNFDVYLDPKMLETVISDNSRMASPNLHGVGATSPSYSPASPSWSPTSPEAYSPTSPSFSKSPGSQQSPTSPSYSPTSPSFSPRTPGPGASGNQYSPNSPAND
ncbi:beta and beta-prime subunits of DNA dependent RNA-polymerase [Trichoderma longibrachiatum ATCC 18648]|uniref:DNA-directed RNA polymerase subunit n=1 Tax=Trichoderma longibrachiatum ATCC 18648 TaxID=983965 RepID=A0A2T4BW54_TRILO|nr:beta and beta-prime subunits of DNA dependent RNA-polymerase [Trichoderma longibrachiatum ATCC 18648]